MAVQDDILELIKEHFPEEAVTASVIAEMKNLSRNTVSHYLNRLVEEGQLNKIKEKPTKFQLPNGDVDTKDSFYKIIGYHGSMKSIIKQCKASVTYPNGIPLILNGPSGTGKSYIAEAIYKYAKEGKHIEDNAPFCVLNCADYANNPELLSSVLFGYVKGAFTGAEKERRGLLDEANGGFLFLDEVHNLTAENQEKLFILIDSGRFRRLGDNENWINTKVRLIMATTEDPRSAMLTTFRRRIPYEVALPKFITRPYEERLELVMRFFVNESKATQCVINVEHGVLEQLARNDYEGNIGELKNIVKVMVANELAQSHEQELFIPESLRDNHHSYVSFDPNTSQMFSHAYPKPLAILEEILTIDDFSQLLNRINEFLYAIEKTQIIDDELEQQLQFLTANYQGFDHFVADFFRSYGFVLNDQQKSIFKAILSFFLSNGYDLKGVATLTNKEKMSYRKQMTIAAQCLSQLFFEHPMMEQFVSVLTAFLVKQFPILSKINAVIIMHGKNNAATTAATVNEMVGNFVFDHFDMPLTVDTSEIIKQIVNYTKKIDTSQGLVILVDMGSLEKIYSSISGNVNGDLIVMNNVSTALALEVGQKLLQDISINQLEQLETKPFDVSKQFFEGISQKPNILVACISGEGIAVKIKDILTHYMNDDVDIITIDFNLLKNKLAAMDEVFFKNTLTILTTPKIQNSSFPVVSIEEVVSNQDALVGLSNYLSATDIKECTNDILKLFTIEGAAARLSFLNPERVIDEVGEVINGYESYYNVEFPNFVRINLFLHLSSMIERMLKYGKEQKEEMYIPNDREEFKSFCDFSELIFMEIRNKYNIKIPISEFGLVYQLVRQSMEY
jgi:sigma-54 dependent transcriptional regulator of gfr operon